MRNRKDQSEKSQNYHNKSWNEIFTVVISVVLMSKKIKLGFGGFLWSTLIWFGLKLRVGMFWKQNIVNFSKKLNFRGFQCIWDKLNDKTVVRTEFYVIW
jgi:hypothetical protein